MKTTRSILIALTAVSALSIGYSASANLITNPGFETGDFTGWTQVNAAVDGMVSGISPHSGNFQAGTGNAPASLDQSVTTIPGASYTIDFWLANTFPRFNSFSASWGGIPLVVLANPVSVFGYTEFTFTETALTTSTQLDFQFNQLDGSWLLDDVSVNPVAASVPDSPSTLGLLLLSLAGLFGVSRFRFLRLA